MSALWQLCAEGPRTSMAPYPATAQTQWNHIVPHASRNPQYAWEGGKRRFAPPSCIRAFPCSLGEGEEAWKIPLGLRAYSQSELLLSPSVPELRSSSPTYTAQFGTLPVGRVGAKIALALIGLWPVRPSPPTSDPQGSEKCASNAPLLISRMACCCCLSTSAGWVLSSLCHSLCHVLSSATHKPHIKASG